MNAALTPITNFSYYFFVINHIRRTISTDPNQKAVT